MRKSKNGKTKVKLSNAVRCASGCCASLNMPSASLMNSSRLSGLNRLKRFNVTGSVEAKGQRLPLRSKGMRLPFSQRVLIPCLERPIWFSLPSTHWFLQSLQLLKKKLLKHTSRHVPASRTWSVALIRKRQESILELLRSIQ